MSDDRGVPFAPTPFVPGAGGPSSGQFLGTLQQILQAIIGQNASLTAIIGNTPKPLQTYVVAVGVSSTPAVPANASRSGLIFHNPGTVDVYVAMATDHLGSAIVPTVGGAGTLQVMAGATFLLSSPGFLAWNAIAASSAVLTALSSPS